MARVIGAFGVRGLLLALEDVRDGARVRIVKVPGYDLRLAARVGRRESDLVTMIHVFGQNGYDFGQERLHSIVDAGANVGYSAVWFAVRHPDAVVLAVEPDVGNLELLRRNTAGYSQISVIPAALMAFDGFATLVDPEQGPWAMRVHAADGGWSDGLPRGEVPCVAVDTLLDQHGLDVLDLLKLDIEGSELDVLASSGQWMPRVQAIVAELHDRFRPGCTAAFEAATEDFPVRSARGEDVFAARCA